jgi:hypothetical protein
MTYDEWMNRKKVFESDFWKTHQAIITDDMIHNSIDNDIIDLVRDMLIDFEDQGCQIDVTVKDKVHYYEDQELDSTTIYKNGVVYAPSKRDPILFNKIRTKDLVYEVDIIYPRYLRVEENDFLNRLKEHTKIKNMKSEDSFDPRIQKYIHNIRFELNKIQ